jgi:hypothetical protein
MVLRGGHHLPGGGSGALLFSQERYALGWTGFQFHFLRGGALAEYQLDARRRAIWRGPDRLFRN